MSSSHTPSSTSSSSSLSVPSRSTARAALAGLLGLGVLGCEFKTDDDTDGSTSATGTTTAGTESTSASTSASTAAAETDGTSGTSGTTTDASSSTTATTTTASSSSTTSTTDATAGMVCDPQGLPECAVDSCAQRWSYSCDECGVEFNSALCFEIDVACAYPKLSCDLPKPCDRVWAYGQEFGVLETFESEDAAICVLTSLRDGDLARHEVLWGQMTDVGVVRMDVFADGAGGATVQWEVDCQGCPTSGTFGRSGVLKLQDQAFFDGCLNAPTTATLLDCMYGFTEFDEGSGLAQGETLPWATGECSALEFGCPG